ncbi:MAG TPA: extracellular solute-binding protein [Nitrososphaeraceae archaeon]|nr:extracellular solute-binding protein [Nitrososphaeraceae archaeon]
MGANFINTALYRVYAAMRLGRKDITTITSIVILVTAFTVYSSSSGEQRQIKIIDVKAETLGGRGEVNVLYAASLLSVLETKIGPAFSNLGYDYKGEGHGSIQDTNMIIDGQRFPDVFISVSSNPINMLINTKPTPLAKWYLGFASDEMVIAYNPKSSFAADFEKAKTGVMPWFQVLAKPGIKFLRTDPLLDPKGCNTVISTRLADILYHNSSLSSDILNGGERNSNQLRPEEVLLTLLEQGEADAIPAYKHEAIERGFPFISLPPQINLGDPAFANYYKQASCTQKDGSLIFGKPIVFDITIPNTVRNNEGAIQFVNFILSKEGTTILQNDGFKTITPLMIGGNVSSIPKEVSSTNIIKS